LRAAAGETRAAADLSRRRLDRLLASLDLDPRAPATSPTGAQWHDLATLLARGT